MTTISKVKIKSYDNYKEALDDMVYQGVNHVGWLNSGISMPHGEFVKVFSNRSGSSCLYCDVVRRVAYSVDMGD